MTAGDWAAAAIGIAALVVALAALPPYVQHKGRIFAISGFLVVVALTVGLVDNIGTAGTATQPPAATTTAVAVPTSPAGVTPSPSVNASLSETSSTQLAGPVASGTVTYLAELQPITGFWPYNQTISISGAPYPHSLAHYNCGQDPQTIEYDLGRKYARMQAVAGMSDKTATGAVSEFEFFVDGAPRGKVQVTRGDATPVDVALAKGLTLKIIVSSLVQGCGDGGIALGDAKLVT